MLDQAEANINSSTTAQLCYLVRNAIHIFSHQTTPLPDESPKKYLPFPNLGSEDKPQAGPTEMTRVVLREALRRHRIPLHVFNALLTPPESGR